MRTFKAVAFGVLVFTFLFPACKPEEIVFPDNPVPPYDEISTILVQNYVNRMYIDLIGREPTDLEMERDVELLETDSLSFEIRLAVMNELMTGWNAGMRIQVQ